MVELQGAGIDDRSDGWAGLRQRMVIGDDHIHAKRFGVFDFGDVGAARVAGDNQRESLGV
jgi:hypothetical protein